MKKTPQVEALPGMTPLGIKPTKEVSVESFNLPSGKICVAYEDEAGARGFCKHCGNTHHFHHQKMEHPPLTEAEKAHSAGAASMSASYWPAPKKPENSTENVEAKGKLPSFGVKRVRWGS